MTSPASGVLGVEVWCALERGDLKGEDKGFSFQVNDNDLTMIISGQRQGLALQFSPQSLSWEATL